MDKRYQVFVSSTYEDLQGERHEVMQALLELDCIPSGMELFPAANEDQWTLIQQVIDDSDYYIVIIGGRYGSVDQDGMSFTEKEYRYALDQGKPVIGFLHRSPQELPVKKTETEDEKIRGLQAFRDLVTKKMCQFWENPSDLGSRVSRSLINLIKKHPAVGWVRADQLPSEDVNNELLELRKQVDSLQKELAEAQTEAPKGTEDLAQGEDEFQIAFSFERRAHEYDLDRTAVEDTIQLTWNRIFYSVSPVMINEASEGRLRVTLSNAIEQMKRQELEKKFPGEELMAFSIHPDSFHTIIIQLRALGLITKSIKNRSVKDTSTYWKLTPYGETVMTQLRAIRRNAESHEAQEIDGEGRS